MRHRTILSVAMTLLLGALGCEAQDAPPSSKTGGEQSVVQQPGRPALQRRDPRYKLERGDLFEVQFPYTPEFNQVLTVQPDGYITLRDLGDIHVEGQTVPELTQTLKVAYGKFLHDPVINIVLKEFEKPYFIAFGEVNKPGKYDLKGDTTVVQALGMVGGFNENAKHSQVLLFRRVSNDWMEVKQLNVKQMLTAKNLSEDLHLEPGDMLYVPKNAISKIGRFVKSPSWGAYANVNPSAW